MGIYKLSSVIKLCTTILILILNFSISISIFVSFMLNGYSYLICTFLAITISCKFILLLLLVKILHFPPFFFHNHQITQQWILCFPMFPQPPKNPIIINFMQNYQLLSTKSSRKFPISLLSPNNSAMFCVFSNFSSGV